jgi:hypothetical protein
MPPQKHKKAFDFRDEEMRLAKAETHIKEPLFPILVFLPHVSHKTVESGGEGFSHLEDPATAAAEQGPWDWAVGGKNTPPEVPANTLVQVLKTRRNAIRYPGAAPGQQRQRE